MIDVGGPSMLRGAAKNFAHVTPVCRPEDYEPVLARATRVRRGLARVAAPARGDGVRDLGVVRGGDRDAGSRDARRSRRVFVPVFEKAARPRLRREPAPGCRVLRRARRAHAPARAGRAAARPRALVQQPQRPERGAAARARVRAAGLRDRQAREPVRRRRRRVDRGGVRAARSRPTRSRPTAASSSSTAPSARRSASGSPSSSSRCCSRPATTRSRSRRSSRSSRSGSSTTSSAARPRHRSATTSACSAACSSRTATGTSPTGRGWRSSSAQPTEATWGDLLFAWRVCKHVTSNAIVIAKDLQTIGIGAGQMSRVDAVRIARREGDASSATRSTGAVLASDAFFPFPDGPQTRARRGRVRADPAGRLEARRGGDRGGRERRRRDGLHRAPALPALSRAMCRLSRRTRAERAVTQAERSTRKRPRGRQAGR